MSTTKTQPRGLLYMALVACAGLGWLIYATLTGDLPISLIELLFFITLSLLVKSAGIHVSRDVEHSLVGIVDLTAILTFGAIAGGWVAIVSAALSQIFLALRERHWTSNALLVRPFFNGGLKALIALGACRLYVAFGGQIGASSFGFRDLPALLVLILAWFLLDHLGWGAAIWTAGGWSALLRFFRSIWRYSLAIELAPMPFAAIMSQTYTVIGWSGFLLISAMLVAAGWVLRRWTDAQRELEEQARNMITLNRLGQELAQTRLDVHQLARIVYQHTQARLDPPDFLLGLLIEERVRFEVWSKDRQLQTPMEMDVGGAVEWLRTYQRPLIVHDFEREDAPFTPRMVSRLPRSAVFVPLMVENRLTGVLSMQSQEPNAFDISDQRALSAIASQAAIAIENARLYEAEQRKARQLAAVAEVSRSTASILTLDLLLSTVVRLIQERFGYYHVQIFVREAQSTHACFRAGSSSDLETYWRNAGRLVRPAVGIMGSVLQSGRPLLANDVSLEPLYVPDDPSRLPDTRAELAVPLVLEQQVLGVLDVQSNGINAFGAEDLFVLQLLADQLAVAVESVRLYEAEQTQTWIATVLLQVAETLSRMRDLEEVIEATVRLADLLVGVRCCVIWLWNPDHSRLEAAGAYGPSEEWKAEMLRLRLEPADVPAFARVMHSRQRTVLSSAEVVTDIPATLRQNLISDELFLAPLVAKGELQGLLTAGLGSRQGRFSEKDEEMLAGIAHQAATAIEGALLAAAQQIEAYVAASLLEVARAIAAGQTLDEILRTIVCLAPILLGIGRCAIYTNRHAQSCTFDLQEDWLVPAEQHGLSPAEHALFLARQLPHLGEMLPHLREGHIVMVAQDMRAATPLREQVTLLAGDRPVIGLPLQLNCCLYGVLWAEYADIPERFSRRWLRILAGIASQTATAIESDAQQRRERDRERMEDEISVARDIQASFLPVSNPPLPGWQLATFWRAARQVSGDFYDVFPLPDDRVGLVIADVADKGVPAALFMALSRTLIKAVALDGRPPDRVLARANDVIIADNRSDMFVTVFYGQIDLKTQRLSYASGGHNPALLVRAGGEVLRLKTRGMALGVMEGNKVEAGAVDVQPGDVVVLYTDGITEAINAREEEFGLARLIETAVEAHHNAPEQIIEAIHAAVAAHVGEAPYSDDIAMVVLRRMP